MPLHQMQHDEDPADIIRKEVGRHPQPCGAQVLIGVYRRPEKTKGGIYVTAKQQDEDVWQGKVGIVLAMGPEAYKDDERRKFHGPYCKVGDWVLITWNSGQTFKCNDGHIRFVDDVDIRGVADEPNGIL